MLCQSDHVYVLFKLLALIGIMSLFCSGIIIIFMGLYGLSKVDGGGE